MTALAVICPLCRWNDRPELCRACKTATKCSHCGGCSSCDWKDL